MTLTEQGRQAIHAIERSVRKTEKVAFRGFDKKEQKALIRFLSRIEANLSEIAPVVVDEADDAEEQAG